MIRFVDIRQLRTDDLATPERFDVVLHGAPIDERGQRSLDLARANADRAVEVAYDPESFMLNLGDTPFRVSDLAQIRRAMEAPRILLDATSLDVVEILILSRVFLQCAVDRRTLAFIYAEPDRYVPSTDAIGMELAFRFSDRFRGLRPVPGYAGELRDDEQGRLVACLGFEADRLDRILQDDDGNFIKHITLICGVPPYRTAWEVHALLAHERIISQHRSCELEFAGANNPKATYERLKAAAAAVDRNQRLIIAPLGSKPSAIGVALFACCRENIRLKYDFPVRIQGKTEGIGAIHYYSVERR